jgi:uncharacterized RDD family membrane protein YckC
MTSADFDPHYGHPPADSPHGRAGGLGSRFFARLIDGILVMPLVFVLGYFLFDKDDWLLVAGLLRGILHFGYFVFFEVTYGVTPGKRLLGLAVHGPGGAPKPDFTQSAIRNSFTLLAVIPYYVGDLLSLVAYVVIAVTISGSPTKQGKHDELAGGTQVVKG